VQGPDGSFEARYLPDGSGVPDDRAPQTDGTGWVLWAAAEVVAAAAPADRPAVGEELRPLVERAAARAVDLTAGDGLPPASPDYWEVAEDELTLGTVAPLLAGLEAAPGLLDLLGDADAAEDARRAAARTRAAVEREFGDGTAYGRYADGSVADAASAFVLPPFQPEPLAGALDAWAASATAMARPAGGLAPGAGWKQDGISWTPQTSLYALVAAENGRADEARARLDWLDAHRTALGALPEKVLADGSPAAVAPLAWTAACVVLAVGARDGGGGGGGGGGPAGGRGAPPPPPPPGRGSERADLLRLRALGALADLELHGLPLLEAPVAVRLDGAVVDEQVLTAVGRGDEPVALLGVEPLDGSLRHAVLLRTA
jgi:hypothetical protein